MSAPLRLALLQYQLRRYHERDAWAAALEARIAQAAQADLLVLPEYAAIDVIGGLYPTLTAELAAACDQHDTVLATMRSLAMRHGVWLLAGSLPVRRDGAVFNRAPLIAPDGRVAWQEKHCLTQFEHQWGVSPGRPPGVFETPWGPIGVCVCYDSEFAPLARAQVQAGAWLLLVPACTDTAAGFNRVRLSARARAIENQCFVAVATTVGDAPWLAAVDANHGYAAVYGPIDRGFPDDGVLARGVMDEPGWLHAELDPARIHAVRREGAVLNHRDQPEQVPSAAVLPFEPC